MTSELGASLIMNQLILYYLVDFSSVMSHDYKCRKMALKKVLIRLNTY